MKKKQILIPAAAVVLVIIIIFIIIILKKNMPNKEHMPLTDYFNVQEGKIQLVLQDEASDEMGLYEDGQVYISMDIITERLNPRFYWDFVENKLLYSTSSAVISTEINSNVCYTNKRKETKDYKIVKIQDDIVYVAIDYIKQYTALDYKKYDNPDRVVIEYIYGEKEKYSKVKKDTSPLGEKVNLVWHQVTNRTANNTLQDLISVTKGVNVVAPTWFKTIDNAGNISSIADYTYMERAHAAGLQVWGLCDDFDPGMKIGKVLSATSRRQRLAKNLMAEAIKYNLDGINIDFENVRQENGEDFVQFIRELGIMCRNNGIVLSIDNYPPASYSQYYNRTEQANVADYVITMAYDEYYSGSEEAGPVSSLKYVKDSVKNTIDQVPAEQVIIALPFYSRLWKETTKNGSAELSSEACSMRYASEIASGQGTGTVWDEEAGLDYIEYKSGGSLYKMWVENPKSLDLKMKAVTSGQAAGMAFWKLGMELPEVWDTVAKYCG